MGPRTIPRVSTMVFRSHSHSACSLQAKLRVQNADDDSSVSSSFNDRWLRMNGSAPTVDGESTMSFEGSGNVETAPTSILRPPSSKGEARGSVGSLSVGEYSVDPETKRREIVRSSSQQTDGTTEEVHYHIAAVEGDSLDESYYLIDAHPQFPVGLDVPGNRFLDVNALASRLASLEVTQGQRVEGGGAESPSPGATGGATAAAPPADSQGGRSSTFTEISLSGGEAHTVTVAVEKKGTSVAWEFMSEPKGLAFGLSYQEDVPGARSQEVYTNSPPTILSLMSNVLPWLHVSSVVTVTDPPAAAVCVSQGGTDGRVRGPEGRQLHPPLRQLPLQVS